MMDDFERDWDAAMGGNLMSGEWLNETLDAFTSGGYAAAESFLADSWMANMEPANLQQVLGANNANESTMTVSETPGDYSNDSNGPGLGQTIMNAVNGLGSWANQNRTLAGLLGSGLLGALRGNNSPDYAAAIKEKEQVDLRTRQRISDSITGMAPITVNRPGLLKTMSGQNVYDQNGRIAR